MLTSTPCELVTQAQLALSDSPYQSLRQIHVDQTEDDALVLTGFVVSFYQKQQAQEIVRAISDGCTVKNAIEVL